MNNKLFSEKNQKILEIFLLIILFLFPFLHVTTGLDISDTGYNLANFENFPDINKTWMVSTFLSIAVGKIFTFLPFGHTIIGMYSYCAALSSIMVLCIYFGLRKYFPWYAVMLGQFIAVGMSWSPKTCLYQYLSYYLFDIGAVLLLTGLVKESRKLLAAAGVVLALNVFVRFPNVMDAALIVVVFLYGILNKKNILKEFLTCLLSYIATFVVFVLGIEIFLGKGSYINMITGLFTMTDSAGDYEPGGMVTKMLEDYWFFFRWYVVLIVWAVVSAIVYGFIKKQKTKIMYILAQIVVFCGVSILLYKLGAFNFWYYAYSSIYGWGVFLLISAIILCVAVMLSKKMEAQDKLISLTVLIIIVMTPLGSNQGLYTGINNLFIVAAYLAGMICKYFKKEELEDEKREGFIWSLTSIKLCMTLVIMASLMQAFLFGADFIFREEPFFNGDFVTITNNDVVGGVRTGKENAESFQELSDFIYSNGLKGQPAIFYGNAPMLSYALSMPCAISHSWPDLDSYTLNELKMDMENLKKQPVIVYNCTEKDYFNQDVVVDINSEKERLIYDYVKVQNYKEIFRNSHYVVMISDDV